MCRSISDEVATLYSAATSAVQPVLLERELRSHEICGHLLAARQQECHTHPAASRPWQRTMILLVYMPQSERAHATATTFCRCVTRVIKPAQDYTFKWPKNHISSRSILSHSAGPMHAVFPCNSQRGKPAQPRRHLSTCHPCLA